MSPVLLLSASIVSGDPAPVLALGAGLSGIVKSLTGSGPMLATIGIGLAGVVGLFWFAKWLGVRRERAREIPFVRALLGAGAGASVTAQDPATRARLVDLQKRFEEGLTKFRASGKSVYLRPWYLMVGPPGSGKTEAIRHCNVGFPPGLQDYLQGAGGTINMHWWFTNQAVIIDTAGRIFMEQADAGGGSEWREFLKLLRTSRSTCPVNGLLLAIGVDSLIKDSADEIEQKATRIQRQLDVVQRELDVRFPVYVVVTKCDLLAGFREFFDRVRDPQLQHQILGWSNPAPLDAVFEPHKVGEHLAEVRKRLQRRRFGLIMDPVHTDDPAARRTDQVDALYALPDSLERLSSRLGRYLELIFTSSEWSPKPLFLRGIYFTSSMRQGAELDQEMARLLNMRVDQLPGASASEERSYFLRDVFISKVFPESGLVTRASNVSRQQTVHRLIGVGSIAAACVLGGAWALWGLWGFSRDVQAPADTLAGVATEFSDPDKNLAIVDEANPAGGLISSADVVLDFLDYDVSRVEMLRETREIAERPPNPPVVLRLLGASLGIGSDAPERVRNAHAAVVERVAVRPLVTRARAAMRDSEGSWDVGATTVLADLLAIERGDPVVVPADAAPAESKTRRRRRPASEKSLPIPFNVEAMITFIMPAREAKEALEAAIVQAEDSVASPTQAQVLQSVLAWTYSPVGGARPWPSEAVGKDPESAKAGVHRFIASWSDAPARSAELAPYATMRAALKRFDDAEKQARSLMAKWAASEGTPDPATFGGPDSAWGKAITELRASHENAMSAAATMPREAGALEKAMKEAPATLKSSAEREFGRVLGEVAGGRSPVWPASLDDTRRSLMEARQRSVDGAAAQSDELRAFMLEGPGRDLLAIAGDGPVFDQRMRLYAQVDRAVQLGAQDRSGGATGATLAWGRIETTGAAIDTEFDTLRSSVKQIATNVGVDPAAATRSRAEDCEAVIGMAQRAARTKLIAQLPSLDRADASWVSETVLALANAESPRTSRIETLGRTIVAPMTALDRLALAEKIDPAYWPDAAERVLKDGAYVLKSLEDGGAGTRDTARRLRDQLAAYAAAYGRYWGEEIALAATVAESGTWESWRKDAQSIRSRSGTVLESLGGFSESASQALRIAGLEVVAGADKDRLDVSRRVLGDDARYVQNTSRSDSLSKDLERLAALGTSASDARAKLASMTPDEVQDLFQDFMGRDDRSGPGRRYIDAVRLRAIHSLASRDNNASDAAPASTGDARAFPLVMDASPSGIDASDATVRSLAGGGSDGQNTIGAGGRLEPAEEFEEVNEALSDAFGAGGSGTAAPAKVVAWARFLAGDGGDAPIEVSFRAITDDPARYPVATLQAEGAKPGSRTFQDVRATIGGRPAADAASRFAMDRSPLPFSAGDTLTFEFFRTRGDAKKSGSKPDASARIDGAWGVMALMAHPDARPLLTGGKLGGESDRSDRWVVPVKFNSGGNFYRLFELQFSRAVPPRSEWPAGRDWP